jgi:hypothetical protein
MAYLASGKLAEAVHHQYQSSLYRISRTILFLRRIRTNVKGSTVLVKVRKPWPSISLIGGVLMKMTIIPRIRFAGNALILVVEKNLVASNKNLKQL